jgi:UDP-N-acetylglucosamine 2-epimerase (non-hydrolysing)/GDP/UDP-N,N'-diacetylbacillosamine 2-epimerase (hydrolysing)
MRKISVVTGTRAEYGLLYWIIKGIHDDPELELQLIVTGMHLSPEFGLTVKEIERDGFPIAEKVEMLLSSDTETAIAKSMGLGMISFANAYSRLGPDIIVVLGDRFEILSAVASAVPFRIPVAHIHGGETTEGAMDELFRHAITKMSHIHFPATKKYTERIIQMGENPDSVFCFGAPGLDNIYKLKLLNKQQLKNELGLPGEKEWGVVTYHPVTLEKDRAKIQIEELLNALMEFSEVYWVFTLPNADTENSIIIKSIKDYVQKKPQRAVLFSSLGQQKYLSLLKSAIVMVGNSSSGIIEAPSFELPVVNISDRQKGRVRAKNVIDVPVCEKNRIVTAINLAISKEFRDSLKGLENSHGNGDVSERILNVLKTITLGEKIIKKTFYDFK